MNDRPNPEPARTVAARYADLDPDDLTTDQLLMWGLTHELVGLRDETVRLRGDVGAEREGRQESFRVMKRGQRLGRIAVAVAISVVALFGGSYIRDGLVTCATRIDSRAATRRGIGAAVDEVADYAHVKASDRPNLNARVAHRVEQELPDPC